MIFSEKSKFLAPIEGYENNERKLSSKTNSTLNEQSTSDEENQVDKVPLLSKFISANFKKDEKEEILLRKTSTISTNNSQTGAESGNKSNSFKSNQLNFTKGNINYSQIIDYFSETNVHFKNLNPEKNNYIFSQNFIEKKVFYEKKTNQSYRNKKTIFNDIDEVNEKSSMPFQPSFIPNIFANQNFANYGFPFYYIRYIDIDLQSIIPFNEEIQQKTKFNHKMKKKNYQGCQKNQKKKKGIEQFGDWYCKECHNLNFSFRKECNRCKKSKYD